MLSDLTRNVAAQYDPTTYDLKNIGLSATNLYDCYYDARGWLLAITCSDKGKK